MDQLDLGIRGATKQSWAGANPRDLLKKLIEEHSGADRPALFRMFIDRLNEEPDADDYKQTIIEYWFANNYHSLVGAAVAPPAEKRSIETTTATTMVRERVREKIREGAQIVLLDMVLPNGKALKDCTGRECRELAPRIGEWLERVAKKVRANELVGDRLSEEQVKALY